MTTTPTAHPVQVRLPGQAAAPDGPVDLLMMYVLHHAFRRDLADFAAAVPATPVDDLATWRALHGYWSKFALVLHNHHTGEDTGLWPLLLQRVDAAGDAEGRATLEAMEAEHAQIDPLLEACADGLRRMAAGGTADVRAALAVRTAAARDALGRHLAHEESEAMVLVQRHLTDDEWLDLERRYFKKENKPSLMPFLVPWVCYGLPEDALRRAFALNPKALQVLWRLTRRGFARRHREAFGS